MSLVTLRHYITPTELRYILYHLAATWKVFGLYLLMNKNNTKQNNTSPETPPNQINNPKTPINQQQKTPEIKLKKIMMQLKTETTNTYEKDKWAIGFLAGLPDFIYW